MQALPPPLQAAINHLLGQASWAREKLMSFAGHAAQIKLPPFEAAFLITPDGSIAAPAPDAELEVAISLPAATPLLALQGKEAVMRANDYDEGGYWLQLWEFLLGLAIAPSAAGVCIGLAAMLAFVARTPLRVVLDACPDIIDYARGELQFRLE